MRKPTWQGRLLFDVLGDVTADESMSAADIARILHSRKTRYGFGHKKWAFSTLYAYVSKGLHFMYAFGIVDSNWSKNARIWYLTDFGREFRASLNRGQVIQFPDRKVNHG